MFFLREKNRAAFSGGPVVNSVFWPGENGPGNKGRGF
jgi:hypothetical protein